MSSYSRELRIAKKIAKKAGKIILEYFDADQEVKTKSDNSQVTIADTMINSMVIKMLSKKFPEDGIIGEEESNSEYGMGRKWFCDPIDGTMAYIWGLPTAMFSLALVIDGVPVLGVVYDPFLKKMYTAIRGEGSFCNKKPLRASSLKLEEGIFAVSGSTKAIPDLPYMKTLKDRNVRVATFSGAVYKCCLIARGRFTAYVENGLNAHDIAAVEVIVEEAGGKLTGLDGKKHDYSKPLKGAVISNEVVHDDVLSLIQAKN